MPFYCIEYRNIDKEPADNAEATPIAPMRIIEAKNEARAVAHTVKDTFTVRHAEPADFMKLASDGGKIEKAS